MDSAETLDSLKRSLELAKEQLKTFDSDIKRITGRDLTQESSSQPKQSIEEDLEVSLASSVVRITDTRSRLDAAKNLQSSDKERGRRMLNVLQGTLKQFQTENASAVMNPQMVKRRKVDARLDARFLEEKETFRRERADLFRARREQNFEVAFIKEKLRVVEEFGLWKEDREKMRTFCQTKTQPQIFFRPKLHNDKSTWLTTITSNNIDAMIYQREKELEVVLQELEQSRRRFQQNLLNQKENSPEKRDQMKSNVTNELRSSISLSNIPKLSSHIVMSNSNSKVDRDFNDRENCTSHDGKSNLEPGELSDTSETFGIEADEPQLMEEGENDIMLTESYQSRSQLSRKVADQSDLADELGEAGDIVLGGVDDIDDVDGSVPIDKNVNGDEGPLTVSNLGDSSGLDQMNSCDVVE